MRFSALAACLILGLSVWSPHAFSQKSDEYRAYKQRDAIVPPDTDFTAGPRYDYMVRQLLTYVPEDFNFGAFRNFYARSPYYTPLDDPIISNMQDLAYKIEHSADPAKQLEAREQYDILLEQHLGNLGVITQALVLSQNNDAFGNPERLTKIRDGLLENIVSSGTGRALHSAYTVITPAEERALLHALEFEVAQTQSGRTGVLYYNMHDGIFTKTGEPFTVFVDTTVPIKHLEYERIKAGNAIDLRTR